MDNSLKQGRGGHVTVKGIGLFNQLQKMNLVLSYEDKNANTTDISQTFRIPSFEEQQAVHSVATEW